MPVYLHGHFGAGEPAPSSARAAAEHVTRTPLERVRVHTGDGVDAAAAAIGARAYTVGRDVHVAREAYAPGTVGGDRLLVHEMVHAAQQGGVAVAPGTRVPMSDPGGASEQQAEAAASRAGDGAARAAPALGLVRTAPRVARAEAQKQTKGIDLTATDATTEFGKWETRDFWWQKLRGIYATFPIGTDRLKTDPEESDAVGAIAFAEHEKRSLPLKGTLERLVTIPARGAKTKTVTYRLIFSPPEKGDPRPRLGFEFLAEGTGAAAVTAPTPAAGPKLPSKWKEAGFPAGGLNGFAKKFKDEAGQLFEWVDSSAPAGAFSQVVHTTTVGTAGKTLGKTVHESTFVIQGMKSAGSVSDVVVELVGSKEPTETKAPKGYRDRDYFDLSLEQLQERKTDALGTITGMDKVPAAEAHAVKFAVWQYFHTGTRNAEVDAIVPIPGKTRRLLYTFHFAGKTNDVHVERLGEEGTDVELDPAKRKLDVRKVRGFDPKADASTLKSWLGKRYLGLTPSGSTPADIVKSVNTKMNADADASPWFASNYGITVLDEVPAKAHLSKTHPTFFDVKQTDGVKDFKAGERKLVELSLQLLSDAVLKLVRGITMVRQAVRLLRVVGKKPPGKPAPILHPPKKDTAGETFTTGTDRTVVLFNSAMDDKSQFIGDKAASGDVSALPSSAMTIEHELGHVTGDTAVPATKVAKASTIQDEFNKKFIAARSKLLAAPVTWYAKKDPGKEFFPEAFAIYNEDPAWMQANLPDMFKWFEEFSKGGTPPP